MVAGELTITQTVQSIIQLSLSTPTVHINHSNNIITNNNNTINNKMSALINSFSKMFSRKAKASVEKTGEFADYSDIYWQYVSETKATQKDDLPGFVRLITEADKRQQPVYDDVCDDVMHEDGFAEYNDVNEEDDSFTKVINWLRGQQQPQEGLRQQEEQQFSNVHSFLDFHFGPSLITSDLHYACVDVTSSAYINNVTPNTSSTISSRHREANTSFDSNSTINSGWEVTRKPRSRQMSTNNRRV